MPSSLRSAEARAPQGDSARETNDSIELPSSTNRRPSVGRVNPKPPDTRYAGRRRPTYTDRTLTNY